MAYWLFKAEPKDFGLDHLEASPKQTARWDEIRNYQARNFLRDDVKTGDRVFIYHSQSKPTAIVGLAEVVKPAYPDPKQFDPESDYFDPKSKPAEPRWYCVDIRFRERFAQAVSLDAIKHRTELAQMTLLKQGRLSVQPVTEVEAEIILQMGKLSSS